MLQLELTSVLAQLQLMAVQRKMFISSMMRKSTPNVMANHSSQLGRMPSSQLGEITAAQKKGYFTCIIYDLCPLTSCLGWIQNKHCGARNAGALLVGSKLARSAVALDETGLDHLIAVVNLHATAIALYNVALQMHLGACHRMGIRNTVYRI